MPCENLVQGLLAIGMYEINDVTGVTEENEEGPTQRQSCFVKQRGSKHENC